jgi:hypothetical protein
MGPLLRNLCFYAILEKNVADTGFAQPVSQLEPCPGGHKQPIMPLGLTYYVFYLFTCMGKNFRFIQNRSVVLPFSKVKTPDEMSGLGCPAHT